MQRRSRARTAAPSPTLRAASLLPMHAAAAAAPAPKRKLLGLGFTAWIFVAMALGVVIGYLFPGNGPKTPGFDGADLKILSDLFVRGIKMIIGPILVSTLVLGIAGHGDDLKKVGRLAFRSILYFEVVTTIALLVGLAAVNLVRPGDSPALRVMLREQEAAAGVPDSVLAVQRGVVNAQTARLDSLVAAAGTRAAIDSASAASAGSGIAVPGEVASADALALQRARVFREQTRLDSLGRVSTAPALAKPKTFEDHVREIVPTSFTDALATNNVLQIVFFSILFAVALSQVKGKPKEAVLAFMEGLAETMFKLVGLVMLFVPFGVGAAMAVAVAHSGLSVLLPLLKLVGTLYGALVVFALVALLPVAKLARIPIGRFLKTIREPALIAFTTTSSDAALPLAMQRMEAFGVPRRIVSFVMPTGYSFNLDGSTLYLALAAVFVAQAAGVELSWGQQALMVLTLMLTSKGVAAVPRASLVILSGTLAAFNLPLAGIAVILSVDELMDMARTSVNLVGNCLATAVMARWEGELDIPPEGAIYPAEAMLADGPSTPEDVGYTAGAVHAAEAAAAPEADALADGPPLHPPSVT